MPINDLIGACCLVTGGNGFIGKHVVSRLEKLGSNVTSVDIILPEKKSRLPGIQYLQLDLQDKIEQTLSYDYVFNLAGFINHVAYTDGGRSVINAHYLGLLNLIEALNRDQLKGFVQIGSSDEYGNASSPQSEDLREQPISCYSTAKVAATHFAQMLARHESFPATVLRFFLVYGPGQNEQRFLPQIVKGCLQDSRFATSAGKQLRDFCYIDDVVDALLAAATTEQAWGEVFNIASGEPVTIQSVIAKVRAQVGSGEPLFGEIPYRPGENMSLYADVSKAERILNWKAKTSLEDGLLKTIEYYKVECETE